MTGSRFTSEPISTSTVRPSASPPSAARVRDCRGASESTTRHRPPNNRACATIWLNADRLVYVSGRVRASRRAPAGAHCGPASRPVSPPTLSTASAPSSGLSATPPASPCVHRPAASVMGRPAGSPGTTASPWPAKPKLPKVRPAWLPPNAASWAGIGSDPCSAIQ